jgi:hypothetical protein
MEVHMKGQSHSGILMLAFAFVALAAFADEAPPATAPTVQILSFFNEGQVFLYNKEGNGSPTYGWGPTWDYAYGNGISTYNPSAAYDSGSIDQEWGFAYNSAVDKNDNSYGFSATIEFGGDNLLEDSTVNSFYTYYKFGDVARILLGLPRYDLGTGTMIEGAGTERFYNGSLMGNGSTTAAQYAAAVDVFPVKGLTVTLAAFIPSVVNISNVFGANWTGGKYPSGNGAYGGWQGISTAEAIDYLNDMGVAATYAVPNIGNFLVQYYRLKNINADGSYGSTNGPEGQYYNALVNDRLDFVANITAWKNYVVKFQYDAFNVAPVEENDGTTPIMTSDVWLSARADFGEFSLTFDSGLAQITKSLVSVGAELQGEYKLGGAFSAGMRLGYQDANGIELFDAGEGSWSGVEVWPYVKASFDNHSYIMLGLVYASGATPAASSGYSAQSSVIAIPIQYVWAY